VASAIGIAYVKVAPFFRRSRHTHRRTPYPPTVAGTISEVGYHYLRGGWVDPHKLFLEDGAEGKAETLALLATFYRACKQFAPVKLGGALLITPDVKQGSGRDRTARRLSKARSDRGIFACRSRPSGGDGASSSAFVACCRSPPRPPR